MGNEIYKELQDGLKYKNYIDFNKWVENRYSVDLAEVLEELTTEELLKFYELSSYENMAKILEQAEENIQLKILNLIKVEQVIKLFSYMSTDNVTDIIGNLPFRKQKALLNKMKDKEAGAIRSLLGYDIESSGGLMTTEYIAINKSLTVAQALNKIKTIGITTEVIETIYILDDSKNLVGTANLRDILASDEETPLTEITDYNVVSVFPDEDQEKVSFLVAKYDLNSIPVINRNNKMLGIITVDDIIDVIEAENTEDMFKMVGINEEDWVPTSVREAVKQRFPWLFIKLLMSFLAVFTVGLFEEVIAQMAILAAVMPIVAGMGGNVGSQALSVVIRGIALGKLKLKEDWRTILKEISIGFFNGVIIGLSAAIIIFIIYGNFYLGGVVFFSMLGNLTIAGLLGIFIPLFLESIDVDPALAASSFLTTATDIIGFFIFLALAQLMISHV